MEIIIREPSWRDARQASKQIRMHNQKNSNMLERMPRDIKKSNFWIARNLHDKLIGFIGIFDWEQDGIEIVSHLVLKRYQESGAGENLLRQAIKKAREINFKIFLFTTEISYYEQYGFETVSAKNFPKKIMTRCQNCPKGPFGPGSKSCPEVAMQFDGSKIKPSPSHTWMFPYFG